MRGLIRDRLESIGCTLDNVIEFSDPSYESAIIGYDVVTNRIIYDYDKMVNYLIDEYDMEYEDAIDFISYNTVGSMCGDIKGYPIIMMGLN